MLLWSLLTAVSGFAHGFVGLLLPRIFVGIGESVLYPASLSLIADYFPSSQLALADGIFFSGIHLGAGSSLLLAGLLGETLGWRVVFFMLGGVGTCLSLALPLLVRELRAEERAGRAQQLLSEQLATVRANVQSAAMLFLRCPSLALVAVGTTGLGLAGSVHPFLQLWMVSERGFSRTEAALSAAVVFIIVGTAASPLMGALADWLYLRIGLPKASFASLLVLFVQTPAAVCFLLYADADSVLFWASLAAWLLGGAILSPVVSTLQELAPPPLRGSVLGLAMLVMNLLGAGVGSLVIGMNADKLAADGLHHPLTYTLVMALLCSNCIQVVCFFAAGWRFERDLKAMRAEHGVAHSSLYTKPG
jgi:MFS family permease